MKKYISILCVALSLCAAAPAQTGNPTEGYFVTPDNVKIFYKIEGRGSETLVAVHGGPGNSLESIRADFEPLAKGRQVIYYDQRGQGRSELLSDGTKLGYEQHVADLEALRVHFKLDRMTLIGNSWGGLLISLYAVAHPDRVERMVLDSPASPLKGFIDDMDDEISRRMAKLYKPEQLAHTSAIGRPDAWLKAKDPVAICREFYMTVLRTYTYSQTLEGNFKGDVCAGGPESVRQQPITRAHVWRSLGDYNLMPKLGVVKGSRPRDPRDRRRDTTQSSEFWAFGYPNARLLVIEKAGHIGQVEAPEIFFPAIDTFLKGSFPAAAKTIKHP